MRRGCAATRSRRSCGRPRSSSQCVRLFLPKATTGITGAAEPEDAGFEKRCGGQGSRRSWRERPWKQMQRPSAIDRPTPKNAFLLPFKRLARAAPWCADWIKSRRGLAILDAQASGGDPARPGCSAPLAAHRQNAIEPGALAPEPRLATIDPQPVRQRGPRRPHPPRRAHRRRSCSGLMHAQSRPGGIPAGAQVGGARLVVRRQAGGDAQGPLHLGRRRARQVDADGHVLRPCRRRARSGASTFTPSWPKCTARSSPGARP